MLVIKVTEDRILAQKACRDCQMEPTSGNQFAAWAQEGGRTVGCALFRLEEPLVWVDQVRDGLIRTCLNYAVGRSINCAQFGPQVDRAVLERLYGNTGERDMENLAYFFQNCKNCSKCR